MSAALLCTPGAYCANASLSAPTGICHAGHYCTGNSTTPTQHACAWAQYCAANSSQPAACPSGFYCPPTTHVPLACSANCTSCLNGTAAGCLACAAPNVLQMGGLGCASSCSYAQYNRTQYATAGGVCALCDTAGCVCDTGPLPCRSCLDGWFPSGESCSDQCSSANFLPLFGGVCLPSSNSTAIDATSTLSCWPSAVTSGQSAVCTVTFRVDGALVARRAHPYAYANFSDGGAGGFFGRHLSPQNKYMAVSFLYEPPALASGAAAQLVTLTAGAPWLVTTVRVYAWPAAATWFLPDWRYRQSVTIDTSARDAMNVQLVTAARAAANAALSLQPTAPLASFVFPLRMNQWMFPFAYAQRAGQDLRFVLVSTANEPNSSVVTTTTHALWHETERWADAVAAGGDALVWIQVCAWSDGGGGGADGQSQHEC